MTFLTGQSIINDALSLIRNNSTSVRTKMLLWLNIQAQKLAVVRTWTFLSNGSAIITPVNGVLTLPADYGEFQNISGGSTFNLNTSHRLTEWEAQTMDNAATSQVYPRGFTESILVETVGDVTTRRPIITLHGAGYTDPVTLSYTIEPQPITDSTSETCWPEKCRPLFMRSLLDFFYEYDMDERAGLGYQLGAAELSELKKWDNGQKPKTQHNRHGYRRTR